MSSTTTVSPIYLSTLVIEPIRYFLSNYAPPEFKWDSDPEKSLIEVASINDFNLIKIEVKPRILISRGGYSRSRVGISDNLSTGRPSNVTRGLQDDTFMNRVQGVIQVLIEGRSEGTVERLTDLVEHFLAWSSQLICDTQNFSTFGKDISISPCTPSKEDTEIFQVSLGIPWIKEERWSIKTDGVSLKNFLLSIGTAQSFLVSVKIENQTKALNSTKDGVQVKIR